MTIRPSKVDTYIDHEGPVAERYQWWGVYLIREKRRLQGIAEAVAAGTPLAGGTPLAVVSRVAETPALTRVDEIIPPGVETPDELLTRVDFEMQIADALSELEDSETGANVESKTQGDSLRDEQTIPDDLKRRKLSGRASLLGKRKMAADEEIF